jgi:regulator of sigma E protease
MGIFIALLVLSFLIFFHELGHFLAARFFGVHVEVFSIGFGKRIWTKKWGDTEWSISAVPLGGYVKMKGQDDTDPTKRIDAPDSYNAKKPWQRIVILLAGPAANFATAFVLYWIIAVSGVPQIEPFVGKVGENTPALQAGLQKGDRIVAINRKPISRWDDIGPAVNEETSKTLTVRIERNGTLMEITLTPKVIEDKNIFGETTERKIIGISPMNKVVTKQYDPIEAFGYAWEQTLEASKLIFLSVEKIITGAVGTDQLGGVITIVDVTAKASHEGILALLWFAALISVNLGVLNLLPIPALDGGHIVFNLYEWITRRPPHEAVLYYLTVAGWAILFGLMGLGLYNDIRRLAG